MAAFANAMLFSMRGILVFVIGFVMLAAAVGCGDAHYDARLAAIDSIIEERPDSALAGLRAMGFDAFSRSDDRAYFALLLTEARYKCYDSIASTDTIDLAVNHFTGNGDREKLTRSLIFKGATLTELGNDKEAMLLYKKAELTANPTDFFNLGYANLRMAELYQYSYSSGKEYIDKYKKSLRYFTLAQASGFRLIVLSRLGKVYRYCCSDSAYIYIKKAICLADSLRDSVMLFNNIQALSRAYWVDSLYEKQKEAALFAVTNGSKYISNEVYYDLISAYSKEGKTDSAQFIADLIEPIAKNDDEYVSYIMCMRDLEAAKGNFKDAYYYSLINEKKSDSIKQVRSSDIIARTETEYERKNAELKADLAQKNYIVILIVTIFIVVLLLFIVIYIRLRYKSNILSNQILLENLKEDYKEMEAILSKNKIELRQSIKDKEISNHMVKSLQDAFEAQLNKIQQVMKFAANVEALKADILKKRINAILFSKISDDELQSLIDYVNIQYRNAISRLHEIYPTLTKADIKIITLMYLGYSNSYICVFMGYTNKQSVINRKQIISQKLGIEESLQDFLAKF